MATIGGDPLDFESDAVLRLREDLALGLRAAALHGLAEGVCNHFSTELSDGSGRFLLNPRGLLWSEVQAADIVMVDARGTTLAGRHPVSRGDGDAARLEVGVVGVDAADLRRALRACFFDFSQGCCRVDFCLCLSARCGNVI